MHLQRNGRIGFSDHRQRFCRLRRNGYTGIQWNQQQYYHQSASDEYFRKKAGTIYFDNAAQKRKLTVDNDVVDDDVKILNSKRTVKIELQEELLRLQCCLVKKDILLKQLKIEKLQRELNLTTEEKAALLNESLDGKPDAVEYEVDESGMILQNVLTTNAPPSLVYNEDGNVIEVITISQDNDEEPIDVQ